jgi:multicomponent Na+:H+ antiporter subunit D
MSLAGVPPLSGFWGKLVLAQAGFASGHYLIIGVSLGVSVLTLYSMTKIWAAVFWKNKPESHVFEHLPIAETLTPHTWILYMVPILTLTALTILMGLAVEPVMHLLGTAANQLMNPDGYIQTVLSEKG